jgi:hypothetical protein
MYVSEWPLNEHSTRNCYNLKCKGEMVSCKEGVNAFYKSIVKYPALMQKCQGCKEFKDFQEVK